MGYNHDVTTGNPAPLYNGIISSVAWSNALDTVGQRAYKYAYDDSYHLFPPRIMKRIPGGLKLTGLAKASHTMTMEI